MKSSFEGRVALVTGTGSGMGLATAQAFAAAGAAVTLADVNAHSVRAAAEALVAAGHKAIGVHCNVADEADVAAMVERTVSSFGRIDAAFKVRRSKRPMPAGRSLIASTPSIFAGSGAA